MGRRSSFSSAASLPFEPSTTNLGILSRIGIVLAQNRFEVIKNSNWEKYLKEQIGSFKVIVSNGLSGAQLPLTTEYKHPLLRVLISCWGPLLLLALIPDSGG